MPDKKNPPVSQQRHDQPGELIVEVRGSRQGSKLLDVLIYLLDEMEYELARTGDKLGYSSPDTEVPPRR